MKTDTPETDEAVKASNGQWSNVLKETCQRLERERDEWYYKAHANFDFTLEARAERDKARQDATNYYARIGELERERDEAIFVMRETRRRLDDAWLEIERLKLK